MEETRVYVEVPSTAVRVEGGSGQSVGRRKRTTYVGQHPLQTDKGLSTGRNRVV